MTNTNPKLKEKISPSILVMMLFDLTMSYIMSIRDTKMKWKVKEVFKQFDQVGTSLWGVLIDRLKKDGQESNFDEYILQLNEVINQFLDTRDPVTLIAMMKAFNQNEINIVQDEPHTNEIIITRQLVEEQKRHLHATG